MRFILLIIGFIFCTDAFSQGKIAGDGSLEPTGNYPIVKNIHVKSNVYRVRDISARNLIATNLRDTGMMVMTTIDSTTYQLQGGIGNSNWVRLFSGGSVGAYTFANGLTNTSGTVKLGGILTDPLTIINTNGNPIALSSNSTGNDAYLALVGSGSSATASVVTQNSSLIVTPANIALTRNLGGTSVQQISMDAGTPAAGIVITDGISTKGLTYNNNYDDAGILDSSWLASWRAINRLINSKINPGGETLQSVTSRGNSTTNSITALDVTATGGIIGNNGVFASTVSGSPAMTSGQFVTRQQVTDTINSRLSGSSETLQTVTNRGSITTNSVGIGSGITSSYGKLQVYDSNTGFIPASFIVGDSTGLVVGTKASSLGTSTKQAFIVYNGLTSPQTGVTGGNTLFSVINNGFVGVGTAAPVASLDVRGTGSFSGTVIGVPATAANHFTTRQQLSDSINNTMRLFGVQSAAGLKRFIDGITVNSLNSGSGLAGVNFDNSGNVSSLTNFGVTTNRTNYMPNRDGRLATLPDFNDTLLARAVLLTGSQSIDGVKTFNSSINLNGAGTYLIYNSSGFTGTLQFPISANRALQFPDETGTLASRNNISYSYSQLSTNTNATLSTEYTIIGTNRAVDITFTLPSAAAYSGKFYKIMNTDTDNIITISGMAAGQRSTVDPVGGTSYITVYSTGTIWIESN